MALLLTLDTPHGDRRKLYVRLNNIDQLTNHDESGPDVLRFRGYASAKAFAERKHFLWELVLDHPIDVSKPVWPQAYEALKAYDPTAEIEELQDHRALLPADAPPEQRAAVEAEFKAAKASHEARMTVATKLRDDLRAAKDA